MLVDNMLSSKHQPLFICYAIVLVLLIISVTTVNSFHIWPEANGFLKTTSKRYDSICSRKSVTRIYSNNTRGANGKTKFGQKTDSEVSRFLTDFRTADGSVVDPYKLLQIKRSATKMEIKQSYRRLSRKLHPDMVAQSDILPGRCQNLDDVRAEWERVKFSYEILSDDKMRKSYDRNSSVASVLEDPGKAVGRAVVGGAMSGIGMVFGGAWKIGEMASKKAFEVAVADKKENVQETNNMEESKRASKQSSDDLSTLTPNGSFKTNNSNTKSKQSISIDSKSNNTTRDVDAKKNNTPKTANKLSGGSDVAMKTITPPSVSSSSTTAAKGQKKKKTKSLQTRGGKGFSKQ